MLEAILIFLMLVGIALAVTALTLSIQARTRASRLDRDVSGLRSRVNGLERLGRQGPPVGLPAPAPEPPRVEAPATHPPEIQRPQPPAPTDVTPPAPSPPTPAPLASVVNKTTPSPVTPAAVAPSPPSDGTVATQEAPSRPLRARLEERLGVHVAVWIGAIALAFAGYFLIAHGVQEGWFSVTPEMRVWITLGFGVVMVAAGELLRNRLRMIPQGLAAAGVAVTYGALWAGVQWVECIPHMTGFACIVVTTAAAIVLSLRHGLMVAVLGLLGGFLTPVMVSSGAGQPEALLYVLILQAGLVALTRYRNWFLLSALVAAGAVTWGVVWVVFFMEPAHIWYIGPYLIGTMAIHLWLGSGLSGDKGRAMIIVQRIAAWAGMIAGMLLLAATVGREQFTTETWWFMGVMSVGLLVLARIAPRYEPMAWMASALGLILVTSWHGAVSVDAVPTGAIAEQRFAWVLLGFGLLHAAGAFACLWGAARPSRWAIASVASGLAYLLVGYWHFMNATPLGMEWWVVCLIAAAAYALAGFVIHQRRAGMTDVAHSLAAVSVGVTSLVSLSLAIALEHQWLTIALALEVAAIAVIHEKMRLSALRWLAGIVAAIVAVRLLANPLVLEYDYGSTLIWNGLLSTYGAPLIAFALAAWRFRRVRDDVLVESLEWGAMAIGVALVSLQVRHAFHAGDLVAERFGLMEWVTWINLHLILAFALNETGRALARRALRIGAAVVSVAALVAAVFVLFGTHNPLAAEHSISPTPVLNELLYFYGVPAILLAMVAWGFSRSGEVAMGHLMEWAAVVFAAVLMMLQVHHGFHDGDMHRDVVSLNEWATHVIGFMLLGGLLLAAGRWWPRDVFRRGGAIIGSLGLIVALVQLCLILNPLLSDQQILGDRILNTILYVYGIPALLAALGAWCLRRSEKTWIPQIIGVAALLLAFTMVSLEVRHWYQPDAMELSIQDPTLPEMYTYTAAWLAMGVVLLVTGVMRHSAVLRYSSLVLMLVVVLKAFLLDTRHLEGMYRVMSFFGLGVSLFVLAFVYQRFVFRRPMQRQPTPPTVPDSQT